jgi:hypothetical protein
MRAATLSPRQIKSRTVLIAPRLIHVAPPAANLFLLFRAVCVTCILLLHLAKAETLFSNKFADDLFYAGRVLLSHVAPLRFPFPIYETVTNAIGKFHSLELDREDAAILQGGD